MISCSQVQLLETTSNFFCLHQYTAHTGGMSYIRALYDGGVPACIIHDGLPINFSHQMWVRMVISFVMGPSSANLTHTCSFRPSLLLFRILFSSPHLCIRLSSFNHLFCLYVLIQLFRVISCQSLISVLQLGYLLTLFSTHSLSLSVSPTAP